ncbi:MAG TPA: type II secretion system F family protein [Candidatus Paceibacterota bacterium]|nr:type II secretion system F family protein [Verrucomicrobiota bacterium]HRZ46393.1 type II secretion system F family protein [Candidatus Paceibacterota bacterium]HRZ92266.1 type II secretion system F family protein [Candidatus Paceibacterota bacterium]
MPTLPGKARQPAAGQLGLHRREAAPGRPRPAPPPAEGPGEAGGWWSPRVRPVDLMVFTRQLATMLDSGMGVVPSLVALGEQHSNPALQAVIRDLCRRVEGGESLSQSLQRHSHLFSRLYIRMVEAGERGGLLAEILARLAAYLESTVRLRRRIKAAMAYPVAVTVAAVLVTAFLLAFVVPVFQEIYAQFGTHLPRPTQWLIDTGLALRRDGPMLAVLAAAAAYGIAAMIRTPSGRLAWDQLKIRVPILGPLTHKVALARFARTFASLFRSGVPILEVLAMVAGTCGNAVMEQAALQAARDIERGDGIAGALARHAVFPGMFIRMLAAGEQTGRLELMLDRIADFWDEEVEATLGGLMSVLEPILILGLGLLIGGLVIAMFLPILSLNDIILRR